jgi:hypothetical protein
VSCESIDVPAGHPINDRILKELYEYAFTESKNYIPQHTELAQEHNGTGMNRSQTDYNMVSVYSIDILGSSNARGQI